MKAVKFMFDGIRRMLIEFKNALFFNYVQSDEGDLTQNFGLTLVAGFVMLLQTIVKYTVSAVISIVTPPVFFVMAFIGKKIRIFDKWADNFAEWWYGAVLSMTKLDFWSHAFSSIVTWLVLGMLAWFAQGLKYVGGFWDYHYTLSIVYFIAQVINFASVVFFKSMEEEEKKEPRSNRTMTRTTRGYQTTTQAKSREGVLPPPMINELPKRDGSKIDLTSLKRDKPQDEKSKESGSKFTPPPVSKKEEKDYNFNSVSTNDVGSKFYDKFVESLKAGDKVKVSLTYGKVNGYDTTYLTNFEIGQGNLTELENLATKTAKETVPDDTGVSIYDRHGEVYLELSAQGYIRVTLREGLNVLGGAG